MSYYIKDDYVARAEPSYFLDEDTIVWQPDVYPDAASLARTLGSRQVIDFGCGRAGKLVKLHPEFEIVGIDYGANIALCRERYDFGTWIEADFDAPEPLPYNDFDSSVLVCADVLEHLVRPDRLLRQLRRALDRGADALLLSTPDRDLNWGPEHRGPPPNPAHSREWNAQELGDFMRSVGLEAHIGLTRSNDQYPHLHTILAVVPGEGGARRAAVANWFADRERWQSTAREQDALLRSYEQSIRDLQEARDAHAEESHRWRRIADELERELTAYKERRSLWQRAIRRLKRRSDGS